MNTLVDIHDAIVSTFRSMRAARASRIDRLVDIHTTYVLRHSIANSLHPHPDLKQCIKRLQAEDLRCMVNALNDQAWHRIRQTISWDHWVRWFGFVNEENRNGGGGDGLWRRMLEGKMIEKACKVLIQDDVSPHEDSEGGEREAEAEAVVGEKWWVRLRPKRWERRAMRTMKVCPKRIRPRITMSARKHARTRARAMKL